MCDREYAVQSTEFGIVEQGHVPILMSLPQMRNLRFQFELHPDKALISSPDPGEIYDKYDRIVKGCRVCSTSVPTPPRARIAGLRASSFGDLIFVDHEEIKFGTKAYLALVIIDGASRARIAGLRASSFGDLIFVDHEEIKFGTKAYLALVIIDGASNLLWATALTNLEAPETLGAFRQWTEENNCVPKGIVGTNLEAPETLGAFRQWTEENNCVPKGIVGDQAFFTPQFMSYYKFHGITPYPCGPRTPWPNRAETAVRLFKRTWSIMAKALANRAETAVRLFKRTWSIMAKALADEGYAERVTVRQAVKKVAWARNCQLTVSGYSPLEIATGRRPPDLFDAETSTPEQLSVNPPEEDRATLDLQRIAMRAHQEARQSLDLQKDLARRVMPSDGPYQKGDRVFVWHKDESKKKSEGVWVFGSEELLYLRKEPWCWLKFIVRYFESISRRFAVMETHGMMWQFLLSLLNREALLWKRFCYEHEICFHSLTSGKSDFVEITPHLTGLTACTCHSGLVASELVLFGEWSAKKIQSSIESAWQVILAAEPNHIIIHPVIPAQWTKKAANAFWHFCIEVSRWQDDRGDGHFVTIMYPAHSGFWLSQSSRSLKWRRSMTFCTFKKGEQQHGEISFLTNAPEGSLDRLESLGEGYSSGEILDPRFAVLLSQCLLSNHRSDLRQGFLFEDIFEDFEDGTLCAALLFSYLNVC
eukprot:s6839_g3.t1